MLLKDLISVLKDKKLSGPASVPVKGIAYDSRKVKQGYLFACLVGSARDGHSFANEAVRRGASCLLCQSDVENVKIPRVIVPDSRKALSSLSARYHGFPSMNLHVAGITGTNGKTSVSFLCESLAREAGYEPGVIGTINYRWGGRILPASQTTPESLDTQQILGEMLEGGCDYAFIEVSSHGIAQYRVEDVNFRTAVFTNLSSEHLDYHRDMDDYFSVKSRLFEELLDREGRAIINSDDFYGRKLAGAFPGARMTYGLGEDADVSGSGVSLEENGSEFDVRTPDGEVNRVRLKLLGIGNVYNALAAVCFGLQQGLGFETVKNALEKVENIKGRFEIINRGGEVTVMVDYAHTPSALDLLFASARRICRGRIIAVFGCGGDRDSSKRPAMGEIAARMADFTVLTTDNPRSEEPRAIIADIEEGFKKAGSGGYRVILDRGEAIRCAIDGAREGDMVIIAGKGHETYQIFHNTVIPFDDAKSAREALLKRGAQF